jgi:hypothetical protein
MSRKKSNGITRANQITASGKARSARSTATSHSHHAPGRVKSAPPASQRQHRNASVAQVTSQKRSASGSAHGRVRPTGKATTIDPAIAQAQDAAIFNGYLPEGVPKLLIPQAVHETPTTTPQSTPRPVQKEAFNADWLTEAPKVWMSAISSQNLSAMQKLTTSRTWVTCGDGHITFKFRADQLVGDAATSFKAITDLALITIDERRRVCDSEAQGTVVVWPERHGIRVESRKASRGDTRRETTWTDAGAWNIPDVTDAMARLVVSLVPTALLAFTTMYGKMALRVHLPSGTDANSLTGFIQRLPEHDLQYVIGNGLGVPVATLSADWAKDADNHAINVLSDHQDAFLAAHPSAILLEPRTSPGFVTQKILCPGGLNAFDAYTVTDRRVKVVITVEERPKEDKVRDAEDDKRIVLGGMGIIATNMLNDGVATKSIGVTTATGETDGASAFHQVPVQDDATAATNDALLAMLRDGTDGDATMTAAMDSDGFSGFSAWMAEASEYTATAKQALAKLNRVLASINVPVAMREAAVRTAAEATPMAVGAGTTYLQQLEQVTSVKDLCASIELILRPDNPSAQALRHLLAAPAAFPTGHIRSTQSPHITVLLSDQATDTTTANPHRSYARAALIGRAAPAQPRVTSAVKP